MHSGLIFVLSILGMIAFGLFAMWLNGADLRKQFSGRKGKGILNGIVIVFGLAVLIVITDSAIAHDRTVSIFVGLDHTKNTSPMCDPGGVDPRTTSNLGAKWRMYETDNERFHAHLKYTHHSCAFNPDSKSYDALGVMMEYYF